MRILLHPAVPWAALTVAAAAARVDLARAAPAQGPELLARSYFWTELVLDAAFLRTRPSEH